MKSNFPKPDAISLNEKIDLVRTQLNKEEAVRFYKSGEWKKWSNEDIVKLQLFQNCLCVSFERFYKAIEKVLERPVWTHEFAYIELLQEEYYKLKGKPSMKEIVNLIPKEKRVIVVL